MIAWYFLTCLRWVFSRGKNLYSKTGFLLVYFWPLSMRLTDYLNSHLKILPFSNKGSLATFENMKQLFHVSMELILPFGKRCPVAENVLCQQLPVLYNRYKHSCNVFSSMWTATEKILPLPILHSIKETVSAKKPVSPLSFLEELQSDE